MKKNRYIILAFFLGIFYTTAQGAQDKFRVAILNFSSENTEQTYARAVRNVFEVSLYKTDKFDILERSQMENILKEQGLQMSGCTDTSCAVKIGKILSANMVVIGTLNKMGEFIITAKFVNVGEGNIRLADSESAASENDIKKSVQALAERMAKKITGDIPDETIQLDSDTDGGETIGLYKLLFGNAGLRISASGSYIHPLHRFENLADPGYGATLGLYIDKIFFKNIFAGIETGCWYLPGAIDIIDYCLIAPLLFSAGYKFDIYSFYIMPVFNIGAGYSAVQYKDIMDKKESEFELMVKAGIKFGYTFNNLLSVQTGAEYGTTFEKDGKIEYLIFDLGAAAVF